MKRIDLLRTIREAAAEKELTWEMVSQSGIHEKWRLGITVQVAVPKHREIARFTAESILKATEPELGEGWWK